MGHKCYGTYMVHALLTSTFLCGHQGNMLGCVHMLSSNNFEGFIPFRFDLGGKSLT